MSSKQLTLDDVAADTPDQPDSAPTPDVADDEPARPPTVDGIPNFNRERGRERTELGAELADLCQQAREAPEFTRQRGAHLEITDGDTTPGGER